MNKIYTIVTIEFDRRRPGSIQAKHIVRLEVGWTLLQKTVKRDPEGMRSDGKEARTPPTTPALLELILVRLEDLGGGAVHALLALLDPDAAVADLCHLIHRVADEEDRDLA